MQRSIQLKKSLQSSWNMRQTEEEEEAGKKMNDLLNIQLNFEKQI